MKNTFIVIFITVLFLLFMTGCLKTCPQKKEDFIDQFKKLIENVKTDKRTRNDLEWDYLDRNFRKLIKECQPKFASLMTEQESIVFWEDALGYVYVRYGRDFLKKYARTDEFIIRIKDSLLSRELSIGPAMQRLCKEWPVLYGSAHKEISSDLKNAFQLPKKKMLLEFAEDSLAN